MSAGDVGGRPSLPHARHRVPTGGQRVIVRQDAEAEAEAETVREGRTITISLDEVPEDAKAAAAAMGLSIESWLRLFGMGARVAVVQTRQDEKLKRDLQDGKVAEQIGSLVATIVGKKRTRDLATLGTAIASTIIAAVLGIWRGVEGPAYQEAARVAVAPAVEAKQTAAVAVDRTDEHAHAIAELQKAQAKSDEAVNELVGAVARLNGAVVELTKHLPPPGERP